MLRDKIARRQANLSAVGGGAASVTDAVVYMLLRAPDVSEDERKEAERLATFNEVLGP